MNAYWTELLESRQIKNRAEQVLANAALRKLRQEHIREVAYSLALNLVRSDSSERAWQIWFWFNHFNVYPQKSHIGVVLQSYLFKAIEGSLDFRFADLLRAVIVHPAMLMYLDNVNNIKAKGNENLARELLELHTLGVSGGYSQQDVMAAARVLTGWTVQLTGNPNEMGRSVFQPAQHDSAMRSVAGILIPAGGAEQLNMLLDRLASHPATAQHIARKMCVWWFDSPPEVAVQELTAVYMRTGGSLAALWQSASELQQRHGALPVFKDPMHYIVSAVKMVCGDSPVVNAQLLVRWMNLLGQTLLGRTSPDGYPLRGSYWLNSGQLAQRIELAREVVTNAARLTKPLALQPDGLFKSSQRFELRDLRSTISGQRWVAKHFEMSSITPSFGSGMVNDEELWSLYLASPEFMYRVGI
jgi:uncharacterized protein (DUF1800 family)